MRVKQILTSLFCMVSVMSSQAASTPSWVSNRPVAEDKYIGISRVALTESGCREKASRLALDEIAAQICVNTESESFMRMVVVDGRSNELFEKKVSQSVSVELEGQKIKDSYESATHYYVYYELDKQTYYKSVAQKRDSAVKGGLDLYTKGVEAERLGNLSGAIQLYANGLEIIEPYLHLSLTTMRDGVEFNVANELYSAYLNVFGGLAITTNLREMSVEAFKSNGYPLAACISKNNKVLTNVELVANFSSGSGDITPSVRSDANGTALFYINNITSKQPIQSVTISIGDSFTAMLPDSYRSLSKLNLPTATITLALVSSNYSAYFSVENNDLEACESQVKMVMGNDYFEISEDLNSDLYILYSTDLKIGGVVAGNLYDMNECFCSLKVEIYNNKTQRLLLKYTISDHKVLTPTSNSVSQAKMTCARELTKIFKQELPKELKKLNLNNINN